MKITIAQALLLLLESYQQNKDLLIKKFSKEKYNQAYQRVLYFYLNGPQDNDEKKILYDLLNNEQYFFQSRDYTYPRPGENDIQTEYQMINNDPTKRYFETHLAFECIKMGIDEIDNKRLNQYLNAILDLYKNDANNYNANIELLNGKVPAYITKDNTKYYNLFNEYADYITRIDNELLFTDEQDFSLAQRRKIKQIVQCSILAVLCTCSDIVDPQLPINIYGKGLFDTKERGNVSKYEKPVTLWSLFFGPEPPAPPSPSSLHLGLLKSHMPLPQNDDAMSNTPFDYLKPSERTTFDPEATWSKLSFFRQVHPFSNSISGTALCQLRMLALFQQDSNHANFSFTGNEYDFKNFFRVFSSTLLFFGGGHSFLEFLHPLRLQGVVEEFSDPKKGDYLHLSDATLFNLFQPEKKHAKEAYVNTAVEEALAKTIKYNQSYLKKQTLNREIENFDRRGLRKVQDNIQRPNSQHSNSKKRKRDTENDKKNNKRIEKKPRRK